MRLFAAVRFRPEIEGAFYAVGERLQRYCSKGNFTRRKNLHLTLAFLGETLRFHDAGEAVLAVRAAPFRLTFGGLDRFRKPDGDIWWIGADRCPELDALHRDLLDALSERGFETEDKPLRPHLTLARRVKTAPGFDREAFSAGIAPITVTVTSIALMESARVDGALTYTPLVTHPLNKETNEI